MEISAARYEYLYTVGGATRKREVELQLHGKMEIISYVQIDSNLRYPTQFSTYAYMYSICGRTHAKRAHADSK